MDRGAWQAVGYGVTESDMSERTHTHVLSASPSCPLLPHLLSGSRARGESPQNKTFWLFLTGFALCDHNLCAVLLWPLPRAQHTGAACVGAVLGAWATARGQLLCVCVCVCVCVYSTLYIKEEVHTSGARTELGGGKEVENEGALLFHKEKVFTLESLNFINKMFTETIVLFEIIISIFYL